MDIIFYNDSIEISGGPLTRVCDNDDLHFHIWVYPEGGLHCEPYFLLYDSDWPDTSTKVARLSFLHPTYIICKNDTLRPWFLTNEEKHILYNYLQETVNSDGTSRWQYLMFNWNVECQHFDGVIASSILRSYTYGEYDNMYYPTDLCYLRSDFKQPDYLQL